MDIIHEMDYSEPTNLKTLDFKLPVEMDNQERDSQQEIPVEMVAKPESKIEMTEEVGSNEPTNLKTLDFKLPY